MPLHQRGESGFIPMPDKTVEQLAVRNGGLGDVDDLANVAKDGAQRCARHVHGPPGNPFLYMILPAETRLLSVFSKESWNILHKIGVMLKSKVPSTSGSFLSQENRASRIQGMPN
jgi:hypothetical protein